MSREPASGVLQAWHFRLAASLMLSRKHGNIVGSHPLNLTEFGFK
jgi:hypothetical protein